MIRTYWSDGRRSWRRSRGWKRSEGSRSGCPVSPTSKPPLPCRPLPRRLSLVSEQLTGCEHFLLFLLLLSPVTALDEKGIITQPHLNLTKLEIVERTGIHARDVRPLDSNNALSAGVYGGRQNLVATLLPRKKQYLVVRPCSSTPSSGSAATDVGGLPCHS